MKNSLYYATDKALSDALQNRKFRNDQLRSLFYSRGVLLSKLTERPKLAHYFSRLNHDYFDHQKIAETFSHGSARDKMTITIIESNVTEDSIDQSMQAVKERLETDGDVVEVFGSEKATILKVNYTVFDTNKTEFKQVVNREALISIEASEIGVVIRSPLNDRVEEIKADILDELSSRFEDDSESIKHSNIELSGIEDPGIVTEFFMNLINGLEGYHMDSVIGVSVFNSSRPESDSDQLPRVDDVSLRGKKVSNTRHLKDVTDEGFYICSVVWECVSSAPDSDLYTLEAKFGDPKNKTGFSYLAKNFRKYKGGAEYNKTSQALSSLEELKFHRLIENSARRALQIVLRSPNDDVEDK